LYVAMSATRPTSPATRALFSLFEEMIPGLGPSGVS
jgi:hypothetical protein